MNRMLWLKGLMVGGLALLLLLPLGMIEGQITARNRRQIETEHEVAEVVAGRQQLTGPLVVVSYEEEQVVDEVEEGSKTITHRRTWVPGRQILVPTDLRMAGAVRVEARRRGLFKAQAYDLDAILEGRFTFPKGWGVDGRRNLRWGRAALALGLSDLRGIRTQPRLDWKGVPMTFQPGAPSGVVAHGIQVDLGAASALEGTEATFRLPLALRGTGEFTMAPVAESTRVELIGAWSTPSFQGRFPAVHQEGPKGFQATWEVFHLARNLGAILAGQGQCDEVFGVAFQRGLNVYLMNERATKYGFLFVGLAFASFFFFELLRRLPIHPIQYLLVGLSLAIFFLLLLSLSERLPFAVAYGVAALACTTLLGAYLSRVLGGWRRGWLFGGGQGLGFALLYGLIGSEDNALLMGSALAFLALAALMLGTRGVDWYALGGSPAEGVPAVDSAHRVPAEP